LDSLPLIWSINLEYKFKLEPIYCLEDLMCIKS
jgi:hypothetical protein